MTSAIEITAPVGIQRQYQGESGHHKQFTPYMFSHNYLDVEEGDNILPYMTRLQSPMRVTFTPSTFNVKRKSRVADTTRNAQINYKPLRRGDNPSLLKFRAPDATQTSLQYFSPWISVTKTDYRDPRLTDEDIRDSSLGFPGIYRRSLTDTNIELSRRNTPAISRTESYRQRNNISRASIESGVTGLSGVTRLPSQQSSSKTDKRVQILDPAETETLKVLSQKEEHKNDQQQLVLSQTHSLNKTNAKFSGINVPNIGINYYNGYLPPDFSVAIAQSLKENVNPGEMSGHTEDTLRVKDDYYKPLIGDRSLYMHRAYPVQPKIMQSDIDQLRLEGRKRFLQSSGQAPVHFSALQHRGTLARPKQKGVQLDEAVRAQTLRNAKSAKLSRKPPDTTAVETFRQQRERTYHLQNLAREMINKE